MATLSKDLDHDIKPLNLLAFPKNEQPICELTGVKAVVNLITPSCTMFFASHELAEQAWHGIIKKISHLLGPLQQQPPIVGTSEERSRRINNVNRSKLSLIEFCLSESSKLLSVKKYQLAIPAAIQALKFTKEIDGDHAISMVEPYLHLAQASLGIKQFHKSEEYLSLAQWIVLNKEDCPARLKSKLHMLIGRTKTSLGQFEEAKAEFSKSVLFSSKAHGPDSAITSMGYFRLGDVFLAQTKVECALAYFDKVVDIWFKYLSALHNSLDPAHRGGLGLNMRETARIRAGFPKDDRGQTIENPDKGHANPAVNAQGLGIGTEYELNEEDLADGRANLEDILEHRRRLLGSTHIATGEVEFTIGLYEYFLLTNIPSAEIFLQNAKAVYEVQLGEEHNSTKHVVTVLELISQQKQFAI